MKSVYLKPEITFLSFTLALNDGFCNSIPSNTEQPVEGPVEEWSI